jgi:hypothetical protein
MSFWSLLSISIIAAFVLLTAALLVVLFTPVVFIVDSSKREFRVRWTALIELLAPLPGGSGEAAILIARRPFRFRLRTGSPAKTGPRAAARPPLAFVWRCLRDSRIRRVVAKQVTKLLKRIVGAFQLTELRSNVSLTDPALNGMLTGALAQTGWGRSGRLRVNFTGDNDVRCEVRLYPFRIARAGLLFFSGMPYLELIRAWRAARRQRQSRRRTHEPGAEHTQRPDR